MRIAGFFTMLAIALSYGALAQNRTGEPLGVNDTVQPAGPIGADDLVAVTVNDSPDLSRKLRVGADGSIRMPLLTQPIHAAGLLPEALERNIVSEYEKEQILVRPSVTVAVLQYSSRPISVAGAVHHPLTFDASGKVTLLSALTRAEGLTPEAGPNLTVTRPVKGQDAPVTQTIVVKELMDGGHPDLNLVLHGGEEIRVLEAPKVFVMGNVKKPGSYSVQDSTDMTVLKVLALAGGDLPFTQKQAYIYRRGSDGKGQAEIPFDLRAMMARKAPDVPLQANDLVYLMDSKGKRLTLGTLDRIATFGQSTGSGLLIFH